MRTSYNGEMAVVTVVILLGFGARAAAEAAAGSRNLALNGSFEQASVLNYPDGWYLWRCEEDARPDVYCDTSQAHTGAHSLCIDTTGVSREARSMLRQGQIWRRYGFEPAPAYTLSFFAKASHDGTPLRCLLGSNGPSVACQLTTDWQRFHVTGPWYRNRGGGSYPDLAFELTQPGCRVWIDTVQLEEGEAVTAYTETPPPWYYAEYSIDEIAPPFPPATLQVNALTVKNEPLRVRARNRQAQPAGSHVVMTVRDESRTPVEAVPQQRLPAADEWFAPINTSDLREGWYLIGIEVTDAEGKSLHTTEQRVFISEPCESWTRIDAFNGAFYTNGRPIFVFGPYRAAPGELDYVKANREIYTTVQDSVATDYSDEESQRVRQMLDHAQEAGAVLFLDLNGWIKSARLTDEQVLAQAARLIRDVKDHPAYGGLHVVDEPWHNPEPRTEAEFLIEFYRSAKAEDPRHIVFFVEGARHCHRYDWNALREATDVIFWDRYGFVTGPQTRTLRNIHDFCVAPIARVGEYLNKPQWRCEASAEGSFCNLERFPTVDEWRAMLYSTIAGGAKGYFVFGSFNNYQRIREAHTAVDKELLPFLEAFLLGEMSGELRLERPTRLIWHTVEHDGRLVLLVANVDAQRWPIQFKANRPIAAIKDLQGNGHPWYVTGNRLETVIPGYGVSVLEVSL